MRYATGLTFVLMCLCINGSRAGEPQGKPAQPYVTLSGTDSQIKERSCLLVSTEVDWIKLWQRHKGVKEAKPYDVYFNPLSLPTVNFDQCVVVAIFQGAESNNAGLRAVSFAEVEGRIVLRFENKTYQTAESSVRASRSKPGEIVVEVPTTGIYGFFVIAKTDKTIVVEEGVRQLLSEPLSWKERARFAKP